MKKKSSHAAAQTKTNPPTLADIGPFVRILRGRTMSRCLEFPTPPRLFCIFLKAPNRLGIKAPTVAVCLYSAASTAAVSSALTLSALLFALLDLLSEVLVQMSPMGESRFFFSVFF